ncbi:right-handed parallel beta-helix repeat-containing protein [Streptomyces sp. NBC_01381]|uniref:right-handed parallel beta-helix repeat-containing protein n=1 Tax=Streptomyces sp. NBC_01381 TaxID=2903845 RepID=UPI0022530D45|nr:right-handed parallel beta-helix repeat-containing protein [Streptomyces sp. NBC_01381]MCX4668933.1 right-handed parallel beta-helix repeat-containing protein [Streptomyces sp. NBC_01381]
MRRTAAASALGRRAAPGALVAAIALIAAGGCAATPHYSPTSTYYVGAAGDDDNDGSSPDKAWRTLARAERVALEPGDRLLLEGGGRFTGTITLNGSEAGDADRPVVIGSYGEGRATVDAEGTPGISVHNTAGVEIRDLHVTGDRAAYAGDGGINLYADRPGGGPIDHVLVSDVEISGFRAGIAVGSNEERTGFKDVTVRQAKLHGNKDAGLLTYGPKFEPRQPAYAHEDFEVEDVTAYRNAGDPKADGRHTGDGIILGSVRQATVRNSTAHDNGARSAITAPSGPVGIWAYDATDVLLEHNTAYRNHTRSEVDGAGFGFDENVSGSTMQYNLAFHNDGSGFYAYTRVVNGAHTDNTIRYNLSSDNGRRLPQFGGLAVYGHDVRNLRMYQNTVVMTVLEDGRSGPALRLMDGQTGVTVRNNNFITDGSPLVLADEGLTAANVLVQGNNYRAPQGQWTAQWGDRTFAGLKAWSAATGQERLQGQPVGLTVDPCLAGGELPDVNSAGDAHLLAPDCAALAGKGLDLQALFGIDPGPVDYFGQTVGHPPPVGAALPPADD